MRIITRTVIFLSLVSLFTDIASEMLYPVMPLYLQSIGFSVFVIGILEGIAEATAGLSKGYFGRLSDLSGRRAPFIQWGYALSAVSKPMMAVFIYPAWIFLARTFDRFGKGIRTAARDAMLSDETAPEHKGKIFGFHRGADTLGAAIGPALALVYLSIYPGEYRMLFILAVIPGLLAVFTTLLIKDKRTNTKTESRKTGIFSYFKYWKLSPPSYRRLTTGLLLFALMNSSDAFLLLMMKHQGLPDQHIIGIYILYNLVYAALSYPLGHLGDTIGLKTTLVIGLGLFVLVYIGIAFLTEMIWLYGLFAVYGAYAAATEGISKALITNLCPKNETATAIGFYTSFNSIMLMLASFLGGWLWIAFSPQTMFVVSACGTMVAIFYIFIYVRTEKTEAPLEA
jgi:MFS family permease